jgi:phage-related protein
MEAVISQKLFTLGQVKDHVGAVPAGENAATDFVNKIDGALSSADGMIDKLKSFAGKSEDVAETVGKFAAKYGPLLLSARRLFGLP